MWLRGGVGGHEGQGGLEILLRQPLDTNFWRARPRRWCASGAARVEKQPPGSYSPVNEGPWMRMMKEEIPNEISRAVWASLLVRFHGPLRPAQRRYRAAGAGGWKIWIRLFIVSDTATLPSGPAAMPMGRLKSPGPLPVFPQVPLNLPSV